MTLNGEIRRRYSYRKGVLCLSMNKYCVSVELSVLDNDLGGRRGRNRIDKGTPPIHLSIDYDKENESIREVKGILASPFID